jgi:hypothetical protein
MSDKSKDDIRIFRFLFHFNFNFNSQGLFPEIFKSEYKPFNNLLLFNSLDNLLLKFTIDIPLEINLLREYFLLKSPQ